MYMCISICTLGGVEGMPPPQEILVFRLSETASVHSQGLGIVKRMFHLEAFVAITLALKMTVWPSQEGCHYLRHYHRVETIPSAASKPA